MSRPWDPDTEITTAKARRLIEAQFPELGNDSITPFGVGFDNAAFLLGGRLVFRFPRRQMGADLMARELRVLPLLRPHLPLPIPAPQWIGTPAGDYPYPFAGYESIPGTTADRFAWPDEARSQLAVPLAKFLAALHRIPVDETTRAWAPHDDLGRADLAKRVPMTQERLHRIAPLIPDIEAAPLFALVERLADTPPWRAPLPWVHGDLYARHLLIGENGGLSGVIDWGDVHLGDPALDLSIAWSFLPPSARDTFRRAYGAIDDATWARARFRALFYGVVLVEYGADVDDAAIRTAGERALRGVLS